MAMMDILLLIVQWFVIPVAVLLLTGVLFERYSRRKLEKTAFDGKTFVTINGTRIHYVKKGQGNCTVVFQCGMGSNHTIWQEVQDGIAQQAVTLSYDRNGIMLSETSGIPVTNNQVTEELEALLVLTQCPKPYILVGHSMAGIYLRPFIHRNQQHVAGIVFAEAAHPLQISKASATFLKALRPPPDWFIHFVVATGIYRVMFSFRPVSPEIPVPHRLQQVERDFFYRSYRKLLEEYHSDALNFTDAAQYTSFGSIPLTVIMGTSEKRYTAFKNVAVQNEYRALVNELQHDLLNLSSNSRLVKAENSGHILQVNDNALLVAEIKQLLPA